MITATKKPIVIPMVAPSLRPISGGGVSGVSVSTSFEEEKELCQEQRKKQQWKSLPGCDNAERRRYQQSMHNLEMQWSNQILLSSHNHQKNRFQCRFQNISNTCHTSMTVVQSS